MTTQVKLELLYDAHAPFLDVYAVDYIAAKPLDAHPDTPVAYEFFNPATGHAIVDYSRDTHVGHLSEAAGYEARPLVRLLGAGQVIEPQLLVTLERGDIVRECVHAHRDLLLKERHE